MTTRITSVLLLFALLLVPRLSAADPADASLTPYFFVEGSTPGVEALPLQSTKADVHISGVIADVTVRQTYRNDGDRTISARYVFPASTRAAVYGIRIPGWTEEGRMVGPVPSSPAPAKGPAEDIELIPMGCARLRISSFPIVKD